MPPQAQKPATPPGSVNNPRNPHSTPSAPAAGGNAGTTRRSTTRRRPRRTGSNRSVTRAAPRNAGSTTAGNGASATRSTGSAARPRPARHRRAKRKHAARRHRAALVGPPQPQSEQTSVITRTVHQIDKVLPGWLKPLLAIALLVILGLAVNSLIAIRRGRKLRRQRAKLLEEIGLLQAALLPEVPDEVAGLALSVAYAPAEGPAAGGDFYDVFELTDGRAAVIVGDISGHGKRALEHTSLLRYTLRAYLGAGFEPRRALEVAEDVLGSDLSGDFATVIVAVYDPDTSLLTYASAGHPPPIVLGTGTFEPITVCSSPPVGADLPTGTRQTTVCLPGAACLCFFTDGLVEGRRDGRMLGRERLTELLTTPPSGLSADELLRRVRLEIDEVSDDMAVCIVSVPAHAAEPAFRLEELELDSVDFARPHVERFLEACGVDGERAEETLAALSAIAGEFGSALLRVRIEPQRTSAEVVAIAEPAPAAQALPAGASITIGS
jgi:serine phosphatase RsbU (regulator of sigma subunit)